MEEPIANSSMLVLPMRMAPALAQPLRDRRLVRRNPALEDLRPAGGRHPDGGEQVLDRDGDARERAERLARRPLAVDLPRLRQGVVGGHVQERLDLAVDRGDPVQVRLGDLGGGDLSGGHRGGQLGRRLLDQLAH